MVPADTSDAFGLLSDPLRWQIISALGSSDRRVGELVSLLDRPQNVLSYHLAELRRFGLASARRSAADGRDVYYRADLGKCRDLIAGAAGALHPGLALVPDPAASVSISGRPKLLFLCTGNSARSQIAEALAVHRSNGQVDAVSAGSHPKPLHPHAVRVLAERGIDIAHNTTKPLSKYRRRRFERVITLCDKVREVCPEFPGAPIAAHWSIPDPAAPDVDDATSYPAFAQIAADIETRVALLLAELSSTTTKGNDDA